MATIAPTTFSYDESKFFSKDRKVREKARSEANAALSKSVYQEIANEDLLEMTEIIKKYSCISQSQADILKLLESYIEENMGVLQLSISMAKSDLLWQKSSPIITKFEQEGIRQIDELIKLSEKLYNLSPKIDYTVRNKARSANEYLYLWLARDSEKKPAAYTYEIKKWNVQIENLKGLINDFKGIKTIMRKRKNNRPVVTRGLTFFILEIALMYEKISQKKFTVNRLHKEPSGELSPITEGMRFLFKAMPLIYLNEKKEIYTPQNIQTASFNAAKILKGSTSNK